MFSAVLNLAELDGSNGFRVSGEASDDFAAWSLAGAGDVNGDGLDDVLIGARGTDVGGIDGAGSVFLVFGRETGFAADFDLSALDGTSGVRLDGDRTDSLGVSVAAAGDINGDGFADVLSGAPFLHASGVVSGAAHVLPGAGTFPAAPLSLSDLPARGGTSVTGETAGDQFGLALAAAGDINGDGFGDVVVGAPGASEGAYLGGAVYVLFGGEDGLPADLDLAALDGTTGFRIDGTQDFARLGSAVAGGSDVNGDGLDDLILGAIGAAGDAASAGAAFVVFGRAGGWEASLDLAALDGSRGARLLGAAAYDYTGQAVALAGDINGDGLADLLVGAPRADEAGSRSGTAYVVFGRSHGWSADISLADLDGTTGFRLTGLAEGDNLGAAVAAAGDINGDGFDDLIVGAPFADGGGEDGGSAFVLFGKANGWSALVALDELDGTSGFRLDGAGVDGTGTSVAAGGDINGDGVADLLVGAPLADAGGAAQAGAGYVIFGQRQPAREVTTDAGGLLAADPERDDADVMIGRAGPDTLIGFGGNDQIIGNGGDDRMKGGDGDDVVNGGDGIDQIFGQYGMDELLGGADNDVLRDDLSFALIDGGLGDRDRFRFWQSSDQVLDLTELAPDRFRGIEVIALDGGGNGLIVDAAALRAASDTDILRVLGDESNTATISADFILTGEVTIGPFTYDRYAAAGAVLLLQQDIAVDWLL